jgi:Uncharacterized protein involved in cation transport
MTVPFHADGGFWLFGYGSLIWKPDVPFDARTPARLDHWARRFWQAARSSRTPKRRARGDARELQESAATACLASARREHVLAARSSERTLRRHA